MTWIFLSPAPVRMTSNAVCSSSSAPRRRRRRAGRGGRGDGGRRDAELLLERLDALGELEHGDRLELVDPVLGAGGHGYSFWVSVSESGVLGRRESSAQARRRWPPRRPAPPPSAAAAGASSAAGAAAAGRGRRRPTRPCSAICCSWRASPPMRPPSARGQAGERRGDHADEAPVEHLAGGQARDRVDLLGRQRLAVHPAALERRAGRTCGGSRAAPWRPRRRRRARTSARSGPRGTPSAPRRRPGRRRARSACS